MRGTVAKKVTTKQKRKQLLLPESPGERKEIMKRKWITLLLALVMTVALLLPLAGVSFAAKGSEYDYNGDGKTLYTSLGDSIAGGFGLPDYNRYGQLLVYGKTIEGAYPTLFAKDLGSDVTLNFYAIPGIRTEDVKYLIGASDKDDWVAETQFPNLSGNTLSMEKLTAMRPKYIEAIKNSDIITLDVGFNDMWMPTIAGIYNIAEYGKIFPEEVGTTLLDRVEKYGSTQTVVQNAMRYLAAWAKRPDKWVQFWATWVSSFTKWATAYAVNMEIMANYIKTVNPDAKVIIPGKFNVFKGWDAAPLVNDNTLGALLQPAFDVYNIETRSICSRYGYTYIDTSDVELVSQDHTTIPLYEFMSTESGTMKFNPHPTAKGHRQIADKLYAVMKNG